MHKNTLLFFLLFVGLCIDLSVRADNGNEGFKLLPGRKLVPVFTADTRAHRLSFQRNWDGINYTASMGGIFPALQYRKGNQRVQMSVAGSTYLTLQRANQSGSVDNVDFFADAWADYQFHAHWAVRGGLGHSSQHLSDDAIVAGKPFKNYAKDYVQTGIIFLAPSVTAYTNFYYNYNFKTSTNISGQLLVQTGALWDIWKYKTSSIYVAGDFKFRQEFNFAATSNFQAGIKVWAEKGKSMRLAMDYTLGTDERGYYQPATRNFFHTGIYFDF